MSYSILISSIHRRQVELLDIAYWTLSERERERESVCYMPSFSLILLSWVIR